MFICYVYLTVSVPLWTSCSLHCVCSQGKLAKSKWYMTFLHKDKSTERTVKERLWKNFAYQVRFFKPWFLLWEKVNNWLLNLKINAKLYADLLVLLFGFFFYVFVISRASTRAVMFFFLIRFSINMFSEIWCFIKKKKKKHEKWNTITICKCKKWHCDCKNWRWSCDLNNCCCWVKLWFLSRICFLLSFFTFIVCGPQLFRFLCRILDHCGFKHLKFLDFILGAVSVWWFLQFKNILQ